MKNRGFEGNEPSDVQIQEKVEAAFKTIDWNILSQHLRGPKAFQELEKIRSQVREVFYRGEFLTRSLQDQRRSLASYYERLYWESSSSSDNMLRQWIEQKLFGEGTKPIKIHFTKRNGLIAATSAMLLSLITGVYIGKRIAGGK